MPQVDSIKDFATLKIAIADLLDRSDLGTTIGMFVQLCEAALNRDLRHHKMVRTVEATGVGADNKISLPPDWLEARNIEVNGIQYVYTSPDIIDMMKERVAKSCEFKSPNCVYTFVDSCLEIFPTPGEDYQIYLDYYALIAPLRDSATGSNWILADHPDIYLYGALVHSAPYLRDDQRIALWAKMFGAATGALQMNSEKAMLSGSRMNRQASVSFG